jgi:hypothetical protein
MNKQKLLQRFSAFNYAYYRCCKPKRDLAEIDVRTKVAEISIKFNTWGGLSTLTIYNDKPKKKSILKSGEPLDSPYDIQLIYSTKSCTLFNCRSTEMLNLNLKLIKWTNSLLYAEDLEQIIANFANCMKTA